MSRFIEVACWMVAIFLSLVSLGITHPIVETHLQSHGSTGVIYQQVQKAAGKTMRENVPVAHVIKHQKDQLNLNASSFQDDISKKLSDLQAKFEELSDQNEAMRRMLDERVNLNRNVDALVKKLGRILGDNTDWDTLGKLTDHLPNDDGRLDERINKVSEYLGNREAELVGYVHGQPRSSSIPFLVNQLRQEPSSTDTKTVIDVIAKLLVQHSLSDTDDTQNQFSPGAPNKEEFHNGSANVIRGSVLTPARAVSGAKSDSHSVDYDGVAASRKIAFSAAATEPQYGSKVPQAVQFQEVMENIGEGFLASNDTFICTVPGYYYFTFSLRTADGKYLGVLLMKNAEYVVGVFTDASDRNTMETQSTVIALQAGDAVWLRLGPNSEYGLYSDSYRYSTFSGFLLFKS